MGLIQARKLWMTQSSFLNDPAEVVFASKALIARLEADESESRDPAAKGKIEQSIHLLKERYCDPFSQKMFIEDHAFIASFSRSNASLSLWRMYAGKNGFCVEFDSELLTSWIGRDEYPVLDLEPDSQISKPEQEEMEGLRTNFHLEKRLQEVQYGPEGVESIAQKILNGEAPVGEGASELRELFKDLASVKQRAYKDEDELRLAVWDKYHIPKVETRLNGAGQLVPYKELAFPHEAIRSITLAPGSDFERGRFALKNLLADGGRGAWSHVETLVTDIEYSW